MADKTPAQLGSLGTINGGDLVMVWPVAGPGPLQTITATQMRAYAVALLGTASQAATGVSGHVVPFLDGANVFSAANTFGGGIVGITDGVAAGSGNVGELVSSTLAAGSALTPNSGVAVNITPSSVGLGAGEWLLWGSAAFATSGGAIVSSKRAWISSVSATDPGPLNSGAYALTNSAEAVNSTSVIPVGMVLVNISSPTSFYLSASAVFSGGNPNLGIYGTLYARRMR